MKNLWIVALMIVCLGCGSSTSGSNQEDSISVTEQEELYDWCMDHRATQAVKCGSIVDRTVAAVNDGYAERKCAIRFMKTFSSWDPSAFTDENARLTAFNSLERDLETCFGERGW